MNLFTFIKETLNADVAAQMAQSVAWRIDIMMQGQARALLKELIPTLKAQGIEEYNELEAAVASAVMGEYESTQAGGNINGPIITIKALTAIREQAHMLAKQLTGLTFDKDGCGNHYEVPDLDEVFFAPVELKVKPVTRARAIRSATRSAEAYGLDEAQTAAKIANTLKRKEDKAKDTSRFLMDQQSTVACLYKLAVQANVDYDTTNEFDDLPKAAQLTLLVAARDSAMRYAGWADEYYWLSEPEFDDIDSCARATDGKLRNHIAWLQTAVANA